MEFNAGPEEKDVAHAFGDMEGAVGILLGLQSVVKARLENNEKEMMGEFAKYEK